MTPLLYAARDGGSKAHGCWWRPRPTLNQADANGITPLLMAITNDHADLAQFLIDRGANPNAADWWGRMAVMGSG